MKLFGMGKDREEEEERTPRQRSQISRNILRGSGRIAGRLISGGIRDPNDMVQNKHLYGGSPGQADRLFFVRRDAATMGNRNTYNNQSMKKLRKLLWGK